jgi:adenylate cyclase
MPKLLASDEKNRHWEKTLPGETIRLGRLAADNTWAAPWDEQISRVHAELVWRDGRLTVRRLQTGRNPIFFKGREVGKNEAFQVSPGEKFLIGSTIFEVVPDPSMVVGEDLPEPTLVAMLGSAELDQIPYGSSDERIEALGSLPRVIRNAPSDEALEAEVIGVLLRAIPAAAVVGIVELGRENDVSVQVRRWKGRGNAPAPLQPSRRLVWNSVRRQRRSILYLWEPGVLDINFTPGLGHDWAFCVPLLDDPSNTATGFYVAGRTLHGLEALTKSKLGTVIEQHRAQLQGDVKFAGLVAEVFGSLRQLLRLQRREATLARFLPEPVRAALDDREPDELLAPRQAEVTVIFCDLRGSCLVAEEGRDDLGQLWGRISEALDIMTDAITAQGGVIGDFQGDAAMGFFGWPIDTDERVERAARAALNIRRGFLKAALQNRASGGLQCGIGIASGPAFAGRLGTYDQAKVSVFGPRVNLAQRLESLTKTFRVPILLDDETTRLLDARGHLPWFRLRKVAAIRPFGMKDVVTVSELLPPVVEPGVLSERDRRDFEAALVAFLARDWETARDLLGRLPGDGPTEVLCRFMESKNYLPSPDWDGVVPMTAK